MNTNRFIESNYKSNPDGIAIVYGSETLTFAQLRTEISKVANALRARGVGKGCRVAFWERNCPEAIVVYYAVSRLSAVFIPINYDIAYENAKEMMHTVAPEVLFLGETQIAYLHDIKNELTGLKMIVPMAQNYTGMTSYSELALSGKETFFIEKSTGAEINAIVFTSGNTGSPKAVAFSHKSFIEAVKAKRQSPDLVSSILNVPIYHIIGIKNIMINFHYGRRIILTKYLFVEDWLLLVEKEKVESVFLPPYFLAKILRNPLFKKTNLSSIRHISYGGDRISTNLVIDAINRFPMHTSFTKIYGVTEALFDVALLSEKEHKPAGYKIPKHLDSMGKLCTDVEVIVVDNNGEELPEYEVGEILVHTPLAMMGYIDPETSELNPYENYWIHTNDLGYIDEQGYLYHTGEKLRNFVNINRGHEFRLDKESDINVFAVVQTDASIESPLSFFSGQGRPSERSRSGLSDMYKAMVLLQQLHETLDIDELAENYLRVVPNLVRSDDYGINFTPFSILKDMAYKHGNSGLKWNKPQFDSIPILHMRGGVPGEDSIEQGIAIRKSTLGEYPNDAKHWLCTPLFSNNLDVLGTLLFKRIKESDPFCFDELCVIRLIANHVCIAIINAAQHSALTEKFESVSKVLNMTGYPIFVSDEDGRALYMNYFAEQILEADRERDILPGIRASIKIIQEQSFPYNTVDLFSSGNNFRVKTVRVEGSTESGQNVYLSVPMAKGESGLNFQCFSDILNDREIDVLALAAQGFYNAEIAQNLNISVNTVKFHLKNLFAKFDVSTRTELIIQTYNIYNSKSPFFSLFLDV